MDLDSYLILGALAAFTLMLNIPFGFLRSRSDRYSLRWFLCVHLPIPFIYVMRKFLMFEPSVIPLLFVAAVVGQVWGGKIRAPKADRVRPGSGAEAGSKRSMK